MKQKLNKLNSIPTSKKLDDVGFLLSKRKEVNTMKVGDRIRLRETISIESDIFGSGSISKGTKGTVIEVRKTYTVKWDKDLGYDENLEEQQIEKINRKEK